MNGGQLSSQSLYETEGQKRAHRGAGQLEETNRKLTGDYLREQEWGLVSERRRNRHFRKPPGSYPLQVGTRTQVLGRGRDYSESGV